jgi:WG containing repeat
MISKMYFILLIFNILHQEFRHQINLDEPSPFTKFNIELSQEKYEKRLNFREGLILIYIPKRKKLAYMDANANVIIPPQYDEFRWFGEGLAPVRKGKKWGFINTKMELVIPFQFDEVSLFHSGKADVRFRRKFTQIDVKGKIIREKFDTPSPSPYPNISPNTNPSIPKKEKIALPFSQPSVFVNKRM